MDPIAIRYAESLFELAKEEDSVETYQNDMLLVNEVFLNDSSFVQFFSHVGIKDDVKVDLLDQCFHDSISTYVLNFLKLLVNKRRIKYILSICKKFQSLCNDYFGIKEGKVYSAYALDKEELDKVERVISQLENSKVQLKTIIDQSLIGGVKVEIDNHIYDDSLSYKLEALKKELLRK